MTPQRSIEQRRDALATANRIRSYRAALKRDIKTGAVDVVDVLAHPAAELASMKVADLLCAVPRMGEVRTGKILAHAQASTSKTLAGLSKRQRAAVTQSLAMRDAEIGRRLRERIAATTPRVTMRCRSCGLRLVEPADLCGFCTLEAVAS